MSRRDVIGEFFRGKKWYNNHSGVNGVPRELRDIHSSIQRFFHGKDWHCGGPIPVERLYNERNFRLLNNISLSEAIEIGYNSIARMKMLAKTKYTRNADTKICLKVLYECEHKNIPQDHIAGLFLLYLELCEKVELL